MKFLLDTNICIYLIKNHPAKVKEKFQQYRPKDIGLSTITVAELRFGASNSQYPSKNHKALDTFFRPFTLVPFDELAARHYGDIVAKLRKKGTPIGQMDALIAAQALSLELTLVTHNLREFQRIAHLNCETWVN